jgi:archaellum biogenesis ATPase FlaH
MKQETINTNQQKLKTMITVNTSTLAGKSFEEKLEAIHELTELLQQENIDVTQDLNDYEKIGLALCELGIYGRVLLHDIREISTEYDNDETEAKFDELQTKYDGESTLDTVFIIAKKYGAPINIELSNEDKVITHRKGAPRTAAQRMADAEQEEPIKKLVGNLLHTGELHLSYGDTGKGKSILAMQIADALTKGNSVYPILPNESNPLKVLFYDFELSDAQFKMRYTNDSDGKKYRFSDLLHIDNINFSELCENNRGMSIDEMIIRKIEADIIDIKPEMVIIDNITYLKMEGTQDAKVALQIMRKLKELKTNYGLSMLVIAHTPKRKNGASKAIEIDDLAGSKHLSNFADSISAIGQSSRNPNERYIKQIKSRSAKTTFGEDNVITAIIEKDNSFLKFKYLTCENEREHTKEANAYQKNLEKTIKMEAVAQLYKEGLSCRDIEEKIGVGKTTVNRWINEMGLNNDDEGVLA